MLSSDHSQFSASTLIIITVVFSLTAALVSDNDKCKYAMNLQEPNIDSLYAPLTIFESIVVADVAVGVVVASCVCCAWLKPALPTTTTTSWLHGQLVAIGVTRTRHQHQ